MKPEADSEPEPDRTFEAESIGRNPWVTALAALPFMLIPLVLAAAAAVHPMVGIFTVHLLALGTFSSSYAWRKNPRARRHKVRVAVEPETVALRHEGGATPGLGVKDVVVPRRALKRGVVVPRPTGPEVHLSKPGPDIELAFEDEATAKALLSKLGFDADQVVATFRTMSRTHSSMGRMFGTVFGIMGIFMALGVLSALVTPVAAAPLFPIGLAALYTVLFAPAKIDVGADGVLVRWLGTRRFISHGDIVDVTKRTVGFGRSRRYVVTLALASGEQYAIPTGQPMWDDGKAASLEARILDAREVFRRGGGAPQAFLMRGDRTHERWVAALRAREVVGHRTAAVQKDVLWDVVEDAAADPIDRAAAAVALGKELGPVERSRLDRVARATAVPRLRVLLEKVADAPDDELGGQLEELEEERAKDEKRTRRA